MRTSAAWGQADARGEEVMPHIQLVAQSVAQLLTILYQREPTEQEMAMCVGG